MEKGIPTKIEKIISIEYLRKDKVYDIEMENPAHNFISESGLVVSNCSHSLAYAYDSIYGAYLKSHYPLEYYTVALNSYQGDFDRTNKLSQELEYFKIKLSNPKFKYSFSEYSCDRNTNTIYKGISSIKGLSKTIGDKLYSLKDKNYPTFFDFLLDCKENSIGIADLTILIKLDYFSEFGTIGKLLKYIDIYNELYGKKMIKKDKKYLVKRIYLSGFCTKETEKQYSGFDSERCLRELWKLMEKDNQDIPFRDKIKYQLDYFGYINLTDENANPEHWMVTDFVVRGNNRMVSLYRLKDGERQTVKIRAKTYTSNPFNKGDILQIICFIKEGKWMFNSETEKWEKSGTTFEDILRDYRIVEE